MRRPLVLLVLVTLLHGCGGEGKAPTPEVPPPVSIPTPAPAPAPEKAPPKSVQDWNDDSFRLGQAGKWEEAWHSARAALALDSNSAAAWFNLGKADLERSRITDAVNSLRKASTITEGTNVDIEYNLGKALWLSGDVLAALKQLRAGAQKFPQDPDFPVLLAEVEASVATYVKEWPAVDLDGDGQKETVSENSTHLVITTPQGVTLYTGAKPSSHVQSTHAYEMPDRSRILRVQWEGCPTGPITQLLWFDPASKQIKELANDRSCTRYEYEGNGSWRAIFQQGPLHTITTRHFAMGMLVETGRRTVMVGRTPLDQLHVLLSAIASAEPEIEQAAKLFASEALYREFMAKTPGSEWSFTPVGDGSALQFSVRRGGYEVGTISLTRTPEETNIVQIQQFTWATAP